MASMKTPDKRKFAKGKSQRARLWLSASDRDEISQLLDSLRELFESLGINEDIKFTKRHISHGTAGSLSREILPSATTVGELLTLWHQDVRYLDKFGNPVPLPFEGRTKSFKGLARKVLPQISAKYLLDEFKRLDVIEIDGGGMIRAKMRSLPVYNDSKLAAVHTVRALRGFIDTLNHNLRETSSSLDQRFFRMAWNGDLPYEQVRRLKIWLKRHGQDLLESADNWMTSASRNSHGSQIPSRRRTQASIGIYLAIEGKKKDPLS